MNRIRSFFRDSLAGRVLGTFLALLPALLAVLLAVYYIVGPGEGYFHSDCSDSLYWANASVESGKVFDPEYRYAGLLPFSASLWMIPLIRIFGFGMTAHDIAMIIFAVLFAASVWFCCASAGFGKGFCGLSVFAVFMMLSSSDKLREILWGHTIYYSMGLILLFCGAGLVMRLMGAVREKRTVASVLWAILCVLLAAGTATDGMQVIVLSVLPLCAALIAERVFCGRDELFSRKTLPSLVSLCCLCCGTAVGLLLLKMFLAGGISSGYADGYSNWSDVGAWADNAKAFVKQYFTLIGVIPDLKEGLFSLSALGCILRIGSGIAVLVIPAAMLVFYRRLSSDGVRLLLWAHFVECAAILFGFICGKLSGANWRLTPLFGSSVLLSMAGIRELCIACETCGADGRKNASARDLPVGISQPGAPAASGSAVSAARAGVSDQKAAGRVCTRLGVLCLCLVLAASCLSANDIRKMPADYGRDNANHRLAAFLESKGLEYGYATFWCCQSVTVISESRVKCREVLAQKSGGVYTDYYQSAKGWYVNQDYDRFFTVLTENEYRTVFDTDMWQSVRGYITDEYRAFGPEDEAAGLGVKGYVITVFDRNILDPAVLSTAAPQ